MKLSELLRPDLILLPLEADDKWQAIHALAAVTVRAGALPKGLLATVEEALVSRERSMTTGMEMGIAIPHAAVEGIPDVIAALGISRLGIPFEALDGKPARIVVGLVIPRSKKLLHIKTLAGIAKLLSRDAVRTRLCECERPEQVLELMRSEEG